MAANRDFPCSGCFSGDSVHADFVTRGQSAPNPRSVRRYCSRHEQKILFWLCFIALNAGQSGPTRGQSGAAAEACSELFQQVHFLVFDLWTVQDSTADSSSFFFLPRSELFLIVQFLGVKRRIVRPSAPDSMRLDLRTVWAPYNRQSRPMQIVLFSLILSSTCFRQFLIDPLYLLVIAKGTQPPVGF